jgi:lipoate-protein ligase A
VPVPPEYLRVIDFGRVGARRSQTLWHAVAHRVGDGSPATLSFVRPSRPYVCIGYHRRLDEVDVDACRRRNLPVYRRMVGGGPVYLDDGQLFFQITVPADRVPPARARALRLLLSPAVEAFRAVGIAAELDDDLEIVAEGRKVCGHGAGQVGSAVVVVGNLIERFDHEAAADVLAAPSARARAEILRLMRHYVASTPADPTAFRAAATGSYAAALGLSPRPGTLTAAERSWLGRLDRRFDDPAWLRGTSRPRPAAWQAKVRAGVRVVAGEHEGTGVVAGIVGDRIDRAYVRDPDLNGAGARVEAALAGRPLADTAAVLKAFGLPGGRVAAALAKATP